MHTHGLASVRALITRLPGYKAVCVWCVCVCVCMSGWMWGEWGLRGEARVRRVHILALGWLQDTLGQTHPGTNAYRRTARGLDARHPLHYVQMRILSRYVVPASSYSPPPRRNVLDWQHWWPPPEEES